MTPDWLAASTEHARTQAECEAELEGARLRLAGAQTKDDNRAAWDEIERLKAEIRERGRHGAPA